MLEGLGSMDLGQIYEHVGNGILGAGIYNGLSFVGKSQKNGEKYSLAKALRTGVAGLFASGTSIGMGYVPAEGMPYYDQMLTWVGAGYLGDNVFKILGWKIADKE